MFICNSLHMVFWKTININNNQKAIFFIIIIIIIVVIIVRGINSGNSRSSIHFKDLSLNSQNLF